MATLEYYFDEIDSFRTRRVRELSEIKKIFNASLDDDPLGVRSKALVVLSYAVWEGFYNDCVDTYCHFLADRGKRIADVAWSMLVGALAADFRSLQARNHSSVAQCEFVEKLQTTTQCAFDEFDSSVVKAKSNLNFERLRQNFAVLDFEIEPIQAYRHRIDKELVGWRHRVAHGDSPTLLALDGSHHISLVATVMAVIADSFQEAMLEHSDE